MCKDGGSHGLFTVCRFFLNTSGIDLPRTLPHSMPFRRRVRRRRRRRSRRFRGRRMMRRRRRVALDPERKLIPFADAGTVTFNGTAHFLNGAAQGVSQGSRLGFQQLNVSSLISYKLTIDSGNAIPTMVRVSLIHWKQPRGLDLTIADVYDAVGTVFAPNAHRELLNALNYRVLWSRKHNFDLAHQQINRTVFRRMRLVTRYNAVGGALGDVMTGGLWLVVISDQEAAPLPVIEIVSRTRFVG